MIYIAVIAGYPTQLAYISVVITELVIFSAILLCLISFGTIEEGERKYTLIGATAFLLFLFCCFNAKIWGKRSQLKVAVAALESSVDFLKNSKGLLLTGFLDFLGIQLMVFFFLIGCVFIISSSGATPTQDLTDVTTY